MVHEEEQSNSEVSEYESGDGPLSTPNNVPTRLPENTVTADSERSFKLSYTAHNNYTTAIAVIDSHSFTRECVTEVLEELFDNLEITLFVHCDEFLKSAKIHDAILYYHHQVDKIELNNQIFTDIETLRPIAPVIILSSVDCPDTIVRAFESGARAFIPTATTTPKQVVEIIRLVRAGGTFVPPSSLSLKRSGGSGLAPRAMTTDQFTQRELAVLECLALGKANKNIAFDLKMSESTVKVHIKSIMNKLKATNRTEVVCRAFDLGRAGVLAPREA